MMFEDIVEISDFLLEKTTKKRAKKNAARKKQHPDWPTHKATGFRKGKRKVVAEHVPVMRLSIRRYCPHCSTTSRNWWLMDDDDFNLPMTERPKTYFFCGDCEKTSALT